MRSVIIPAKRVAEQFVVRFPFGDQLEFGETIMGGVVTAVVSVGTDPLPADVLFGAATVDGVDVLQTVTGGVAGVVYQLVAAAAGSGTHIYTKSGFLAIVNDATAF